MKDLIDVAPLRAAVVAQIRESTHRSGIGAEQARFTWSDAARACGWVERNGRGDGSRLRRRLGDLPEGGKQRPSRSIHYGVAVHIARSLEIDFHEVGV